ncbi:NfeD family protein [Thermoflavimicrobium daqui]|uniref:Protease n=1 Tax=Thermoflavimicrobium daqui TaxID=2137476 RepID=A0A364K217_9BACL|nr:NfeD family protein [Thermoflavimicrobium daqui]RAL22057.1 protease [Thermoflavimicrobium daqui]
MTILSFIFSNFLDGILDSLFSFDLPIVSSVTIFSALTVFGGSGLILSRYTEQPNSMVITFSLLLSFASFILVYFLLVRPSQKVESSVGFRLAELKGKKGVVITTIPRQGMGEVMITTSGGNTNQIAQSATGDSISQGTKIIVSDVAGHILLVKPLANK